MKLYFETYLPLAFEKIRDRFDRELFIHLSSGLIPFNMKRFDGCKEGDEYALEVGVPPVVMHWAGHVTYSETNASGWSFIDEGKVLPWPLIYWKHHHRVDKISQNESKIVDDIEFHCRNSLLAQMIRPVLWGMFAMRPNRYKSYFKETP